MFWSRSSRLPLDPGAVEQLNPIMWNENDSSTSVLTSLASVRPVKMVGVISGTMSTSPVLRAWVAISSLPYLVQVTFWAAGSGPHHESFRVTVTAVPFSHEVKLNGPVPTGFSLAYLGRSAGFTPSHWCLATMGTMSPRSSVWGLA